MSISSISNSIETCDSKININYQYVQCNKFTKDFLPKYCELIKTCFECCILAIKLFLSTSIVCAYKICRMPIDACYGLFGDTHAVHLMYGANYKFYDGIMNILDCVL